MSEKQFVLYVRRTSICTNVPIGAYIVHVGHMDHVPYCTKCLITNSFTKQGIRLQNDSIPQITWYSRCILINNASLFNNVMVKWRWLSFPNTLSRERHMCTWQHVCGGGFLSGVEVGTITATEPDVANTRLCPLYWFERRGSKPSPNSQELLVAVDTIVLSMYALCTAVT